MSNQQTCGKCLNDPPDFDLCTAVFEYREPVSRLIYQFKYHHQFQLGKILAHELLLRILESQPPMPELIIGVPLHKRRLIQRGFNQSILLGQYLAKHLDIPINYQQLVRTKYAQPQITLTAQQRFDAVKDAFEFRTALPYRHVALVDDVISTTNTVNQAAKALKNSGVDTVSVWAIARNT